jgi:hypothetical protein
VTKVPSRFAVPLKPCGCGVLAGEECDCLQFAADAERLFRESPLTLPTGPAAAPAGPSAAYPTPLVLELRDGLLRRVEDSAA